jgi:hypothetical protein
MHYPQLPDPYGWDVFPVVADDWYCTQTGPVSAIHFWISWKEDITGPTDTIQVSIRDGVTADPPDGDWGTTLWARDFTSDEFTIRAYDSGEQGWYDVAFENWSWPDHYMAYQINIEDIENPFIQQEGEVYWLSVRQYNIHYGPDELMWGWKTSLDHFGNPAVGFSYYNDRYNWLHDPITSEPLDMAFVIAPEPTTIFLLSLGSLFLLRKHKAQAIKNKK